MIGSLYELSETVNSVVNRMVEVGTQKTSSGNYYIGHDHVADLISEEDYLQYFDFIYSELIGREEVLDLDAADNEFNCIFALDYCPHYEWCDGDESVFGCSREEWENTFQAKPVSHPLSMSRMAEIGEAAIPYVIESSDMSLDDLTECLGMSLRELEQLGVYDAERETFTSLELLAGESPMHFRVWEDGQCIAQYDSFEEAYAHYSSVSPKDEKDLSYMYMNEAGTQRLGFLLQNTSEHKRDMLCALKDEALKNPHIALAHAKATISLYPFDEKAWALRDEAEKDLGIKDREVDVSQDLLVGKWRVHLVPPGGHYGLHNQLVNEDKNTLVEFVDMSQDKSKFPNGQFVTRYSADTLLGNTGHGFGHYAQGLHLDASIPEWTVSAREMDDVMDYVREAVTGREKPSLEHQISSAVKRTVEAQDTNSKTRTDIERG